MEPTDLKRLKEWFNAYVRGFYTDNEADNRNISLKETHTDHVCANMRELTAGLNLPAGEQLTAQAIALLHDVGRFEQYRRFATFRDDCSVNHAALGVRVLTENRLLAGIAEEERTTILTAVSLHNVFRLPENMDEHDLLFARLIRDADKLDIWRVFVEFYQQAEAERASAAGLGFPDLPGCSPEVLACLERKEIVNLTVVKSLNDLKLLQLSWIFDLCFAASCRLVLERGLVEAITATIPKERQVMNAINSVWEYAAGKAKGDGYA